MASTSCEKEATLCRRHFVKYREHPPLNMKHSRINARHLLGPAAVRWTKADIERHLDEFLLGEDEIYSDGLGTDLARIL